jgi:7-cyano-7-deazaguanine synthase
MTDSEPEDVCCINFYYGSKHNAKERAAAIKICSDYYGVEIELVDMHFIGKLFKSALLKGGGSIPEGHYAHESMRSTVVPFRNGIMISIAVGFAESIGFDCVMLANHSGDHSIYPDCRQDFISAIKAAAMAGTYKKIGIESPFVAMDKGDIVKVGHDNNAPLQYTWTCYNGLEKHCGRCGACIERKEAFQKFGIPDPTRYMV